MGTNRKKVMLTLQSSFRRYSLKKSVLGKQCVLGTMHCCIYYTINEEICLFSRLALSSVMVIVEICKEQNQFQRKKYVHAGTPLFFLK